MSSVKESFFYIKQYLENKDVIDPKLSAEALIADVLGVKRLDIYLYFDRLLNQIQLNKLKEFMVRRGQKEPLEYILNYTQFFNCELEITKDVLIPRSETEQLVELLARQIENKNLSKKKLIDICTGSGCIAIALKKRFKTLDIAASDISREAIELAKKNSKKNNCDIDFRLGDLLTPFKDEKVDYVVCNPPYISEDEYEGLIPDVKNFEPKKALVAKEQGFYFYKNLSKTLLDILKPNAKVFFEIGYMQKKLLFDIFSDERWISKKVYKDLSLNDRFFFLEIE